MLRTTLIILAVLASLFLMLVGSCYLMEGPPYYYSDPIHARVIDEETEEPVEGAVVVAYWEMSGWQTTVLHRVETVTDGEGRFVIPAMPRKLRPPFRMLEWADPRAIIYKPGYSIGGANNRNAYVHPITRPGQRVKTTTLADGRIMSNGYSRAAKRYVYWNGRTIPLRPAKTPEEEVQAWKFLRSEASPSRFNPRHFPQTWRALIVGYRRLPPEYRNNTGWGDPAELVRWWQQEMPR